MDIKEFIEKISEQFEDTDPAEITTTTEFKNLDEWSSLTALSIIAMVDEEYDIQLNGDDLRRANTIEDLYNIVKSK